MKCERVNTLGHDLIYRVIPPSIPTCAIIVEEVQALGLYEYSPTVRPVIAIPEIVRPTIVPPTRSTMSCSLSHPTTRTDGQNGWEHWSEVLIRGARNYTVG